MKHSNLAEMEIRTKQDVDLVITQILDSRELPADIRVLTEAALEAGVQIGYKLAQNKLKYKDIQNKLLG